MTDNGIVQFEQGGGSFLSMNFGEAGIALEAMSQSITQKAQRNLEEALAASDEEFGAIEKRAMLLAEEVKLVGEFDLAQIMLRGERIRIIREEGLYTAHPNGYPSLEMMARDMGISASELSNTIVLYEEIFPWLAERGTNIVLLWGEIGKSNFREIIPYLRSIITGEGSQSENVNERVREIVDEIRELSPELELEEVQLAAVEQVLDAGANTTREMRAQLRPSRTPAIDALFIKRGDRYHMVATLSEDQKLMLARLLRAHMDEIVYDYNGDRTGRTRDLFGYSEIVDLYNLLEG